MMPMPRQMTALSGLSIAALVDELAAGLPVLLQSAEELMESANDLPASRERGRAILSGFAEEEAAKILMLLDLLRCPMRLKVDRKRQGRSIYDHHARLLYAECYDWRPATFGELRQGTLAERESHYVDGPNDVDWIYRNSMLDKREAALYADRISGENGFEWRAAGGPNGMIHQPRAVALEYARSFAAAGAFAPAALKAIASFWGTLVLVDDTDWQEVLELNVRTLAALQHLGFDVALNRPAAQCILHWPMPMYSLDLREIRTDVNALQRRRDD